MKLTINTPIYNERRYGRPYIGIANPTDGKVTKWGTWIGTPGEKGILEIDAQPGEVVIKGQKDNRGNSGAPNYGVVQADGSIEYMGKAEAVQASRAFAAQHAAVHEPTLQDILAALSASTTAEAMTKIAELHRKAA